MRTKLFIGAIVAGAIVAVASSPTMAARKSSKKIYLSTEEIEQIKKGTACRNLVQQFFRLQKVMSAQGLTTDFYDLKILSTNELISGKRGKYYAVNLKDATKKARFQFPGGRYVIDGFETRFRRSVTAFVREVLAVVSGGAEYDLFVRGGSSATPMSTKRELVTGHKYSTIRYMRRLTGDIYAAEELDTHSVPKAYGNDNLPFLRAAFLRSAMGKFFPVQIPKVLEGRVSTSEDTSKQFAEMILYIDW